MICLPVVAQAMWRGRLQVGMLLMKVPSFCKTMMALSFSLLTKTSAQLAWVHATRSRAAA
jgi:hypothetical protein